MSQRDTSHLEKIDREVIWHPFTQMRDWEKEAPLIVERAEGNYLYDIHGKRYLDGISSLWVTVHGHRKKEIDDAVKAQIDRVAHSTLLGLSNVPAVELAEKLLTVLPQGLQKIFYSDNGSTAVEIALKMAFQYAQQTGHPRKTRFLTLKNAYHGDTIGSVSLGGIDLFHEVYRPLLFETIQADITNAVELVHRHAAELAAVVVEPVMQGAAGMLKQPPGFLTRLRAACTEAGVTLVFDEVATGFGRTGKMFACEHESVTPDILCAAKGLTGGYLPLAITATTNEIYRGFHADHHELKTFFHGHTYTGNPLACAAAIANLEVFEKERTLDALQGKIARLMRGLEGIRELAHVKEIRQAGFMVGIDLMRNRQTPYELKEKIGIRVIQEARARGVILRPLGNVIVLMPPLSISDAEIDFLIDVTRSSIQKITQ